MANADFDIRATSKTGELARPRSRSVGLLTVLLIALTAFSFAWYILFSHTTQDAPVADTTDVADTFDTTPFYVLLVGSDTRRNTALYTGSSTEEGQIDEYADIITLVRVDPGNRVLSLVTVPRDTLQVGTERKINTYLQPNDASETMRQVQRLCGREISYYIMTTFWGYMTLVDEIGGVVVNVPQQVSVTDPTDGQSVTVNAGLRQLNGSQALVFARARKEYGDNQEALRQNNVRTLEAAMIDQVAEKDESDLRSCLTALAQNSVTNMDHTFLVSLALDYAQHRSEYTVYSGTGPYEGDMIRDDLWAVPTDLGTWAALMDVVDAGGDPTTVVQPPEFKSAGTRTSAAETGGGTD